ncbi:MAG: hypothetical protein FJ303_09290 [Planctomycetes bacterium]|nr:hypothetical protein [Planctomycetota bacterium]
MSDAASFVDRLEHFVGTGGVLHVAADGRMLPASAGDTTLPKALLPGSFNPVHRGHWELAKVAAEILRTPVAFELSVVNVDKPALCVADVRRRLAPFKGQASVWLTHAARFVDKADQFPGATFIVGADTALRIVQPRYYDDDASHMIAALTLLRDRGCRILIACRTDAQGKCWKASELPIPFGFRDIFMEIPESRYRWDISSTQMRSQG